MKLNEFNKKLKKEYKSNQNIENNIVHNQMRKFYPLLIVTSILFVVISAFIINKIYVDNYNNGLIFALQNNIGSSEEMIKITNKDELNKKINKQVKTSWIESITSIFQKPIMINSGVNGTTGDTTPTEVTNYDTNVREKDIDESDIAKCDGTYIYYIYPMVEQKEYKLVIYDLDSILIASKIIKYNSNLAGKHVTSLLPSNYKLYIYGNSIIVESSLSLHIFNLVNNQLILKYESYMYVNMSRLIDNYYYCLVFSGYKEDINDFDNLYYDGYSDPIKSYKILKYNLDTNEIIYLDILSSNIGTRYINKDYIILTTLVINPKNNFSVRQISYDGGPTTGDFTIISIFDTDLNPICVFKVIGRLINDYSVDIQGDLLRLVTTRVTNEKNKYNNLLIYSIKEKRRISIIEEGLGIGYERVTSVRFENEKCFVVTYMTTDPLYEIDLSNPYNPRIIDQYKAPGFSQYLHTITINSKNYVLGLGVVNNKNKISLYKDEDTNIQIGEDYIIEETNEIGIFNNRNSYRIIESNIDNSIYLGLPISKNLYVFYKIDVEKGEISIYKKYEINYYTRSFIIDSKIYIPNDSKLIVDNFY